ncbi:hypothetical protein EV421DRAFT_1759931 [Armillaria borealis]|uniref:GRF-type domain-containing protein n=1 Tax=Armillaria borealis TaxID=47425 RepID=A0AA39K5I7_9AGAR|nr:hypothetical protein EV421DRAFT_1759931 [Armillaria borealis]
MTCANSTTHFFPEILMSQSPMVSKVDVACYCNVPARRRVSYTKSNPNRPFFRCHKETGFCNFFAWEDSLVSPDSQPTPSTPLKRLDDGPTQANSQGWSQGSIERDVFSPSQSQSQPKAEYTLTPVPMPKGVEESGLPTSSESPNPFRDDSPSQTDTHTPLTALDQTIINKMKEIQSQFNALARPKIAAVEERDARSEKLEYLESENKRLNESLQSLQSELADHKNTIRALSAALLQCSQDSRPRGDVLTLTQATLHYTASKEEIKSE